MYLYQNPTCTGKDIINNNANFSGINVRGTDVFWVKPKDKFNFGTHLYTVYKKLQKIVERLAASKEAS